MSFATSSDNECLLPVQLLRVQIILRLKFATVSAVSGSVCKGQVSWRARNDTIMCRFLRVQIMSVCFEFRGDMPGQVSGGRIAIMFRFCFCNICIGEGSSTKRAGVVYEFRVSGSVCQGEVSGGHVTIR